MRNINNYHWVYVISSSSSPAAITAIISMNLSLSFAEQTAFAKQFLKLDSATWAPANGHLMERYCLQSSLLALSIFFPSFRDPDFDVQL